MCLIFSRKTASIFFESLDGKSKVVLKLNPQEATLYMMIAKKSMEKEGLDWREHIPTKEKIDLLREYNQYYRCVGKGNVVKGYKDRTQTHHIKTKIRLLNCLANMDMFVPECVRHDNLSFIGLGRQNVSSSLCYPGNADFNVVIVVGEEMFCVFLHPNK